MKATAAKLILTPVVLMLQVAVAIFVIGIARELGAPAGSEFPYALLVALTLPPVLICIWSTKTTLRRRIGGWFVGVALTMGLFLVLHPVALKAYAFDALYNDPFRLEAVWPLIGVTVGSLLIGIVSARMVLRMP